MRLEKEALERARPKLTSFFTNKSTPVAKGNMAVGPQSAQKKD